MGRFKLEMSGKDLMMALAKEEKAGGFNPGALRVCMELMSHPEIDPDSGFGPIGTLLHLDECGIYGSDVWGLYSRVCGENLSMVVGVLRAVQLGFISKELLRAAIAEKTTLDLAQIKAQVQKQLPNFRFS